MHYIKILVVAAMVTVLYSNCKKPSGIDNGNVIETPYSLYFVDTLGAVYKTNDGLSFNKVFNPDGFPAKAIITSGEVVLLCKNNIYSSIDNGHNFNHAYDSLQSSANLFGMGYALNNLPIDCNQSMIIEVPGGSTSPSFVYACSDAPDPSGTSNYLGVAYNNNHGLRGNWSMDNGYDTTPGMVSPLPVQMVSFALMKNGTLVGLALNHNSAAGGPSSFRNFINPTPLDAMAIWQEVTGTLVNSTFPDIDTTLPPNVLYPGISGFFTLGRYNDRLIAIDQKGACGAWYSDDMGRRWKQYSGLPSNVPLLCVSSPFDQVSLIGTYGDGLYIYNQGTGAWQRNNSGLGANITVRGITSKRNYYKNGTTKDYIYLATSLGIYQSTDMGLHWTRTIPGNFKNIY